PGRAASRRHRSVLPRRRARPFTVVRLAGGSRALGNIRPGSGLLAQAVTVRNVSYSSTLARKSLCVFSGRGYSPGPYHGVSSISFKGVLPHPLRFLRPPLGDARGRES
ncbi:hypothetical protein DBV15_01114, partial [Temnothorax longispinosus]